MSQKSRPFSYPTYYVKKLSDFFENKIIIEAECKQPIAKNNMQHHIERVIYAPGIELVFSTDNTFPED
jgi:hypothetical protein